MKGRARPSGLQPDRGEVISFTQGFTLTAASALALRRFAAAVTANYTLDQITPATAVAIIVNDVERRQLRVDQWAAEGDRRPGADLAGDVVAQWKRLQLAGGQLPEGELAEALDALAAMRNDVAPAPGPDVG